MSDRKVYTINIRLSKAEGCKLKSKAEAEQRSINDIVRELVRSLPEPENTDKTSKI